ncbi:mycofactocin biosynthesis chaperone MftB [Antrihabitans cavernicola]|uniref:Mycofactocin biosynthesis chaperone MftB n=1 Tax=Antrihabitans cavernicola TaxID=2495913 RepID=A0A5A7S757_9NOCA|nr:mycofactocin biosynthesis chaperone MftB [Spelaeibacter cavernicola]KAA0020008.1 mycofactocin biosynthesis chaperone MftB [Spelaeibacter cavernicola]
MSTDCIEFELEGRWRLHPQVALRSESFGALLYHFGTRKLSFLKDRTIVELVQSLDRSADAATAFDSLGIAPNARATYVRALSTLVDSHMLVRDSAPLPERTSP